jgi:hypothetical protein
VIASAPMIGEADWAPGVVVTVLLFGDRLQGHRPRPRAALDASLADAQEDLGAREQHDFGQDQGQRSARQPDRDGGAGGVARHRHRAGAVRRRRLQGVRDGQIEAAVRSIGSRYPYDDIEHQEVTLRGNHDEVGVELRKS